MGQGFEMPCRIQRPHFEAHHRILRTPHGDEDLDYLFVSRDSILEDSSYPKDLAVTRI